MYGASVRLVPLPRQTTNPVPRIPPLVRVCVQVVSLGEAPPASDLIVVDRQIHTGGAEGGTNDGGDASSIGNSSEATAAAVAAHSEQDMTGDLEKRPGLSGLDASFDRDFVDALCREGANDFFLYGSHHRSISTPA